MGSHLLLVEDNSLNARICQQILEQHGYSLDLAIDGKKALTQLAKRKYAAVLMDLELPVMDGLETTRSLRAGLSGSLNQRTPVIAITAHSLKAQREDCLAAGMEGIVVKPFDATSLLSELARHLPEYQN